MLICDAGMGVFADKCFKKGDFLLHYFGELITEMEAERRELTRYRNDKHSYLYNFKFDGKKMW